MYSKGVTTLALGSWPKQGLVKVQAKSDARGSHFMLLGVWENVKEWTTTLPSELPLWELDFRWTSKSSKCNYRGQNPLDCGVPYIIGNLLELICLKWARMTHLGDSNISYGQKKGRELNFLTTKSRESPWLPCVQMECNISLEISWWGLQLSFRPHLNRRFAHKIIGLQSHGSPNFGTPTWESQD
jgi:hypothetical protein